MVQDFRYAWRMLLKSPGFTAVVILTLAIGIGANTAVFSMVNGVLLRPLPYHDPDRLVDVLDASVRDKNLSKTFGTYSDFEEYARHARSFERIAFATWTGAGAILSGHGLSGHGLSGNGPARNVLAIPVSEDFFAMLGVPAERGRTFTHDDLRIGCPVVLSHAFWRETFAADPAVLGRTITLNQRACTAVGVMPARFAFYPHETQLWMLLTPDDPRPRDKLMVISFARLKPGVTAWQAQTELAPLHQAIHPDGWQRDFTPVVNHLQDDFTWLAGRNIRATLGLLLAAVGLVLLIACLNVSNLLLVRALVREREFAVRAALGSGRARLIRQSLTEGLLTAIFGGALGVLAAYGMIAYFRHANPIELPVGADISISLPVLGFTALLSVATALVFGMAPAWSGSHTDLNAGLRASGRGAVEGGNQRLARALIVSEIALSLLLLTGAGLLMQSVLKMGAARLGFDPDRLLVMNTGLPEQRYADPAKKLRFYDELSRKLNAIPGVEGAALAWTLPPFGSGTNEIQVEGNSRTRVLDVAVNGVSPDYFRVLRIAPRRGRMPDTRDGSHTEPVAVINQALAREYFPGADPIGRRVRIFGSEPGPWLTIAGVVENEKRPELLREMSWGEPPMLYRPMTQDLRGSVAIAVRTQRDLTGMARTIEQTIAAVDSEVPAGRISSMREVLGANLKYSQFRAVVLSGFAAVALLLAVAGLHGLLAQYVAQRTQEIGVRMALGAQARDVIRLISVRGGIPVIAGLGIGLALAIALTRYLASLLFEVQPLDPATMGGASLALIAAAALAIVAPARRAARIDPMVALRDE
jgi:predicted permease